MFDYIFIALLVATWWAVFFLATPKKRKNRARLFLALRAAGCWWVIGMAYNFLGFLVPDRSLLGIFDKILTYTIALPCRLGISMENARVGAFGAARFDLALAMIMGLPFALLLTLALLAAVSAAKKARSLGQSSQSASG